MPIRPELRPLYPPNWRALSAWVRFERAQGRCQICGRPHLANLRCLPDGRWFDAAAQTWRDRCGRPARWPTLLDATQFRTTRVVLAAPSARIPLVAASGTLASSAHLDHDPTHNRLRNLRALCQRCHLQHDRPHHRTQRWITCRTRYALGDLFLGPYDRWATNADELICSFVISYGTAARDSGCGVK